MRPVGYASVCKTSLVSVPKTLTADVRWDDGLAVNVRSVDVPFISVSPKKLNSAVEKPLSRLMAKVEEYAEIRAFRLMYGCAVLEAVRK